MAFCPWLITNSFNFSFVSSSNIRSLVISIYCKSFELRKYCLIYHGNITEIYGNIKIPRYASKLSQIHSPFVTFVLIYLNLY